MRFTAVVMACATVACLERRVIDVPLDGYAFEYGFIVLRGVEGITRVSAPFGIAGDALTFGALPAYELEDEEQEMLLVALPEGAVLSMVPLFDRARADRLELIERGPKELPFFESQQTGDYLTVELPMDAMVLRGDFEGALEPADRPELALRVPFTSEACGRIDPAGLVPFGTSPSIVPPEPMGEGDNFFFVELLEDDLAVAMTPTSLHLFRAGETYTPVDVTPSSPGNRVDRPAISLQPHRFNGFVLDREANRVWLAGYGGPSYGVLVELSIDESGLRVVSTTTTTNAVFAHATMLADRRLLLLGFRGEVLIYDGRFEALPPLGLSDTEAGDRIHPTKDAAHPYLASSTGRLHLFDAEQGAWDAFEVPSSWLSSISQERRFRGTGLASSRNAQGELELWAAGTSSVLIRKEGDRPWERYHVPFPPRFALCSGGALPYPDLSDNDGFDSIEIVGDDLFLSVRRCTAALQIRRNSPCVALLTVGGFEATYLDVDLQALDVRDDRVLLGGENGLLYRGTLR